MKLRVAIGLGGIVLCAAASAAFFLREPVPSTCPTCNVLLISIDTLRADHLGSYGYPRPTSPNLDEFRKSAVLFETAIAQAPSTAASHGAIFTSQLPSTHGALFARRAALSPNHRTIAEILQANGFRTASFNGGGQLSSAFGFARGFEQHESIAGDEGLNDRFADQVAMGIKWLDQIRGRQFFLFLHTYETHIPYGPGPEHLKYFRSSYTGNLPSVITSNIIDRINSGRRKINSDDRQYIIDAYDAEIRSVDEAFGELLKYLRSEDLLDSTLIIVTSDHGEEFGEHGKVGVHSYSLYDELLKVPLIVKLPYQRLPMHSVATQVRSIDIVPTILDILELPPERHQQGKSLAGLLEGSLSEESFRYALSQKDTKRDLPLSVRTSDWKMLRRRLFNLRHDPGELTDVSAAHPDIVEELSIMGKRVLEAVPVGQGQATDLKPEALEQLKTLGYLN